MHMSLLIILDTLLCIIILFINKLVSTFITKKICTCYNIFRYCQANWSDLITTFGPFSPNKQVLVWSKIVAFFN
jgi:hypothetical protein